MKAHPLSIPSAADRDLIRCGLCRHPTKEFGAVWQDCPNPTCDSFMFHYDGRGYTGLAWHHRLECEEIPGVCQICWEKDHGVRPGSARAMADMDDDAPPRANTLGGWL